MIKLVELFNEEASATTYQLIGKLTVNTTKRTLGDILADIRAIERVTIVRGEGQPNDVPTNNPSYTEELKVKIDPFPFTSFGKQQAEEIISLIKHVNGVTTFIPSQSVRKIK